MENKLNPKTKKSAKATPNYNQEAAQEFSRDPNTVIPTSADTDLYDDATTGKGKAKTGTNTADTNNK